MIVRNERKKQIQNDSLPITSAKGGNVTASVCKQNKLWMAKDQHIKF